MKRFFSILIFIFLPVFVLAANKININTATLQQLEELVGVGPTIGQRIIDARPYASVDDLLKVQGIGDKTLQKIKDQGLAYVTPTLATLPKTTKTDNTGSVAEAKSFDSTQSKSEPERPKTNALVASAGDAGDNQNSWILFIAAIAIVVISGVITIIKIKLKK